MTKDLCIHLSVYTSKYILYIFSQPMASPWCPVAYFYICNPEGCSDRQYLFIYIAVEHIYIQYSMNKQWTCSQATTSVISSKTNDITKCLKWNKTTRSHCQEGSGNTITEITVYIIQNTPRQDKNPVQTWPRPVHKWLAVKSESCRKQGWWILKNSNNLWNSTLVLVED